MKTKLAFALAFALASAPALAQLSAETYDADGNLVQCIMREVAAPPHQVADRPFGNCNREYVGYCAAHGMDMAATCPAVARGLAGEIIRTLQSKP